MARAYRATRRALRCHLPGYREGRTRCCRPTRGRHVGPSPTCAECIRRNQRRARPHTGKLTGLVRALRAEVPAGLCIYCPVETRLTGRQTVHCGSLDCRRAYRQDIDAERQRLAREARHG